MHLKINKDGLDIIKYYESFSSKPYYCPSNLLTIGYGHVIKSNEQFSSINIDQAEELLNKDISIAEKFINRNINIDLNSNEFSALISLVYNIGNGNFQRSTLRIKLNRDENRQDISNEFLRWDKSRGKVLNGLTKRRVSESLLFLA